MVFSGIVWVLLLVGIFVWPELVLAGLLLYNGYPILAVVAFASSFWSGKQAFFRKLRGKTSS